MLRYIDVSEWQGTIDWERVKGRVDGVLLRAGHGAGQADRQFARNAAECNRLGIPCGAYWFSYAFDEASARAEAAALLAAVKPWRMELPLCFDYEYDSVAVAERHGVTVTRALATGMVRAFCEAVEAGGYYALFYANPDFLTRYFDAELPRRFGLWLAQWPGGTPDLEKPPRPCAVWQWTCRATVEGIAGAVDESAAYSDFAELIRAAGINALGGTTTGESPQSPGGDSSPVRGAETAPPTSPNRGGAERSEAEGFINAVPAPPVGRADPGAPLSDALAWAVGAGILPAGAEPTDIPTLAALAEMFFHCRRDCPGGSPNRGGRKGEST